MPEIAVVATVQPGRVVHLLAQNLDLRLNELDLHPDEFLEVHSAFAS